ncbi:MAG: hypothetical protein ABFD12_14820, partial [Syntrophorhabdus sp.]
MLPILQYRINRRNSGRMTDMFAAVQATTAGDIINAYLSGGFLGDFVTVIMANLILSSDNAVVIAL